MWTVFLLVIHLGFIVRVILRPHREPASRVAWVATLSLLPLAGILAYLLLGETSIGRRRANRLRKVLAQLPHPAEAPGSDAANLQPALPEDYVPLFRVGHSINGYEAVGGNQARLLPDSNSTIESMVRDIDAAESHVHLAFYIWLPDNNGLKIVEALKRAAARQVTCRAMADGLGSRILIDSIHWKAMRAAGVRVAIALPLGSLLLRPLRGRFDLRYHRKILVIDNRITYCGSQNCADPEFLVKAKYAPWVDAMMRFEGPIARQNQHLFASGWMDQVNEDLGELLRQPVPAGEPGLTALVIGTGPTARYSAMPEVFETLIYAAQRELFITTPYYVPDEALQRALCASARRGVGTTMILPARNDSWFVAAASRSYYDELLAAGVRIFEYQGGLLHTKSLVLDGEVTLIGSANLDRRSFELNYENNILFYDPVLSGAMRRRQDEYLARSLPVTSEMVSRWPITRRLWNNTIAMFGPVLCFVLFLGLAVRPSSAVTLADFARSQPLIIRTVARGESPDLGEGNQTNNLKEGGNVLVLSYQDLTSLAGISRLPVLYRGLATPIAQVPALQVFLNHNALSSLPNELAELGNITFLYLFYNQFDAVPAVVTRLTGLQGLYLTGNRIRELPPGLFAMRGLRKLQVSKNRLSTVPPAIGDLVHLIHLREV